MNTGDMNVLKTKTGKLNYCLELSKNPGQKNLQRLWLLRP